MEASANIGKRKFFAQYAKFAGVGSIAFAIDYGSMIFMTEVWHVDYLVSTTCAYLLSVIFNYFASMRFVYTRKEEMTHSRAFSIFLGLSAVGLLLNDGFMYLMTTIASVDYRVSKLAVTFGVSLFNFFTRRHFLDAQPAHIRAW